METRHVPPAGVSRTLGIDLASQPINTAACVLEWDAADVHIVRLEERLTDDALVVLMRDPRTSRVAIDAPFGWPTSFVEAINAYTGRGDWPATDRSRLLLRETDRQVKLISGQQPLSVSADRIAYAAMRCASLLAQVTDGNIDRTGDGRYVEVYPAAALRLWGFDTRRYKGPSPEANERRRALLRAILDVIPTLALKPAERTTLERSDHALDALVCAVVARVAETGSALPVPADCAKRARLEGWIRLPAPGALNTITA